MKFTHYLTVAVMAISSSLFAQQDLWRPIDEQSLSARSNERWVIPQKYNSLELNKASLANVLGHTPKRDNETAEGTIFTLPMPDGSFQNFRIWESPIMAPELAERFREIKTYSGQGVTNPAAAIYLDWTPQGFHAMVLEPGKISFVDPYFQGDDNYYVAYDRADYHDEARQSFGCETEGEEHHYVPSTIMEAGNAGNRAVTTMRTYRIAIATTGEYTVYHGGTQELALAAINTTLNRVRGIYETELSVSFTLISNNVNIIYTNGATDPYSNPPTLAQNQTNITNVIGSSNYDIGHVFSAVSSGGGGIATVGSVCTSTTKARGMTATVNPKTDAYDVDFVAHEIGHQFGAHHTFNGGVAGSCSVANYYANKAYEPGSGSTIMAYTGICDTSLNLQRRSNAYFHNASLNEINVFTTIGNGNTCGNAVATTNNPPTADADPNGMDGKYIPISTPFELTGAGSDPDGNPITYVWEQYDLGPQGAPSSSSATAPMFRSFTPTSSAYRSFPVLHNVLDNKSSIGEKLPSVSRDLKFRLTTRDNQSVGGGFAYDSLTLHVVDAGGAFSITSHNTSSTVNGSITVTWNVAGTTSAPINCGNVDIMLSLDGGITFTNVATATANDGTETITLPNSSTSAARIKIKCSNNVFYDINNADLRISPPSSTCSERVSQGNMSNYTSWTEYSSNGYFIIDNYDKYYHNALGSALLGSVNNETSRLSQAISIPSGSHFANLEYWYKFEQTDCGGDVFNIKINGSIVKSYNMCNDEGAGTWKRELIDLSAYIATSPTIMFEVITNNVYPSYVYVDDVSVYTCEGGSYAFLPVELLTFDARSDKDDALLHWSTASEKGNIGFEIEMRTETDDFQKVGFVAGKGNSDLMNEYSFTVKDLKPGAYYFRLKQLDVDGNFTFSPIRQLIFNGNNKVIAYPNPAVDVAYFEFSLQNSEQIKIDLLDNMGRVVGNIANGQYANGVFKIAYNTSHLPNGVYYYRLNTDYGHEVGKFVIAK